MQCSNCQFQNMPGVQTCGRCGASLLLASSAVDVHPPRASRAAKRWRRWFPMANYWNRFRDSAAGVFAARRVHDWPFDVPAPRLLLRSLFPGWAQWHLGRAVRARWVLGGYLAFLLSALLFFGTALGWLLMGLAISIHAASIMDVAAATVLEFRRRLIYSSVTLLVLIGVVYYPAGRLLTLVASPQQFNLAAPPFEAGDVVLVNPSAYRRSDPQPGDVVLYRRSPQRIQAMNRGDRYPAVYQLQGDRVDRILARAGDRATSSQGLLFINGQLSPWLPLNPLPMPDGLEITVPEDSFLIFPSADPLPPAVWQIACIVPRGEIAGRVYWRNQPLWRFGPIR